MKKIIMSSPIGNQHGSVMALALMVMVTLTIVGLTAVNDTVVESSIARNHAIYRMSLYLAEAAVRQAVQIMEDYTDDPAVTDELMEVSGSWVKHFSNFVFSHDLSGSPPGLDWVNMEFRDGNYGGFLPCAVNNAGYLVRYEGIAEGSSLDMTDATSLYQFSVYGRGVGPMQNDLTETIVKVGYRMRY